MGGTTRAKYYAYRIGRLEAVIVPLKVQYKSTLPLTNPKAVVNQKYKAVLEARGFYPFFLMSELPFLGLFNHRAWSWLAESVKNAILI